MKSEKIEVEYLGWQERVNAAAVLLVNEVVSHTTVVFDERKHILMRRKNHGKLL